jgi:hypothetical protein
MITLDGTTGITSPNDTTGNQSYTGTLTGGTGVVNLGSGQFYKDASGNVGIGTSSPISIAGYTIQTLNNATTGSGTYYQQAGTSIGRVLVTSSQMFVGTNGPYPLLFTTNAAEAMRIDSSGNVGIGTASPSTYGKLAIAYASAASTTTNVISIYQSAGVDGATARFATYNYNGLATAIDFTQNSGTNFQSQMTFSTNGGAGIATRMVIDSAGRVAIGTSATYLGNSTLDQVGATRPLTVYGSDAATTIAGSQASITIANADTTTSNTSQIGFAAITGANTNFYTSAAINCVFGARTNGQYPSGQLVFSTSTATNSAPTEKMRIDSSGNVGIGTTSPTSKVGVISDGAPATSGNMSTGLYVGASNSYGINIGGSSSGAYAWINAAFLNNSLALFRSLGTFSPAKYISANLKLALGSSNAANLSNISKLLTGG